MYALEPSTRLTSVFETLRREIVAGELRPNSPLIELDLAQRFEVSRTPVRESLQRLATAGLVVPRKRGWAVREFTTEEIRQNAEVRMALEGYAAGLAATRASATPVATGQLAYRLSWNGVPAATAMVQVSHSAAAGESIYKVEVAAETGLRR